MADSLGPQSGLQVVRKYGGLDIQLPRRSEAFIFFVSAFCTVLSGLSQNKTYVDLDALSNVFWMFRGCFLEV